MASPLRILYLEDDVNDTELVRAVLEADGLTCEIVRVETRAGFLAAVERGEFDLSLADYSLPAFDLEFRLTELPSVEPRGETHLNKD